MIYFRAIGKTDIWGAALGFFAAVSQVVLLREALSVSQGNESSASISFMGWFLGVALGALLAKPVAHRFGTPFFISVFSCASVLSGFVGLRMHRAILGAAIGQDPSLLGMTAVLLMGLGLGGLATGSLFTVTALRLQNDEHAPVSRLYAAESLGAVMGTMVFYFALVHHAEHLTSLGVAAVLLFFGAWLMSNKRHRIASALVLALWTVAIATGGLARIDSVLEQMAFRSLRASRLIASTASAYGRLSLAEQSGQYELLADGRFDHAFPDPYDRPVPIHVALTAHPNPEDILILGGGPTDRLEAALAHHPRRVVMTYLNDKIESLCRPYWPASTLSALSDPRMKTVEDDGRRYIRNTGDRFDVVIISARPPRSAAENRFYTEDFYKEVSRILKMGGIVAAIASGGANVLSKETALSAASTLAAVQSVFRSTFIIPGLDTLILASSQKGGLAFDAKILAERYRNRGVRAPSFSAFRFDDLMDIGRRQERLKELRRVHPSVNTDEHPSVYSAGLSLWERSLGGIDNAPSKETVTSLLSGHAEAFFIVPMFLLVVVGIYSFRRAAAPAIVASVSIAVTGAAGMACQVLVMPAFQVAFGTLYSALALLVGMFMLGLAIGAFIGRKFLAAGRTRDVLIADLAFVIFLTATGPVLRAGINADMKFVMYAWSTLGGVLTGAAFPAFLGKAQKSRSRDERTAAPSIEFADHMGAAFGAFVTGLVWIPAFGITVTCLLFAGLKFTSMVVCAFNRNAKH
jgi:spermidine synthase